MIFGYHFPVSAAVRVSVEEVCSWLSEKGLAEYSHSFRAQAIDGRELLAIDGHTLEDALGMGELRGKDCRNVRVTREGRSECVSYEGRTVGMCELRGKDGRNG